MEELFYKIEKIKEPETRKILPMLFPNYINIFPVIVKEKDLEFLFNNDIEFYRNILVPVIKNKWSKETIIYDFNNNKLSLDIINDETSDITISNDIDDPEIYAYTLKHSPNYNDYKFCKGVYIAAEKLGIITGHSKFERNDISIFDEHSEFTSVSLRSLELYFQIELFTYWKNRDIIFITGGTGIGKTSQIPKLLFWFDTLFSWDNKDKNHHHTLLSLPKVQLVDFFGNNFNNSINSSAFLHKYYYGSNDSIQDNSKSKILVCTNKISSKRFLHDKSIHKISSIILDEIHESDIHTIINLCLIKKFRSLFNCIVLMSATPGDNLKQLKSYFPEGVKILMLPNIELYKITEIDMYDENISLNESVSNAIKKYKPKNNEAGVVFCPNVREIKILNEHLISIFPKFTILNIYSKSPSLKEDIKSIETITTPLILLSTNLLESSITIKKLKYVYDLGKCLNANYFKIDRYNISKESMLQRRGRVGRVSPGKYIKLYQNLGNYNFMEHMFLYPIILFNKVYKFKSIYGFNEKIEETYKKEKLYFNKIYKSIDINQLLTLYNNNLCTVFESLLVYDLPYQYSKLYRSIESISVKEIPKELNTYKLHKIAIAINLKLVKSDIFKSNIFTFKEPFYKKDDHKIVNPRIVGKGNTPYFITQNLIINI